MATSGSVCEESGKDGKGRPAPPTLAHTDGDIPRGLCPGVFDWNDKKWSIVNHFIPYTEAEVGSPERFESDFMVRYMADKVFSPEATAVLAAGRVLWSAYFTHTDPHTVREELKLNRPDVGWYQIRNALKRRNLTGDTQQVPFTEFETAYQTLTQKLRPQVYSLGFLK